MMFCDVGVIDRLLGICRFMKDSLFETVDMDYRDKVELALSLDQQQLADLYNDLCERDWSVGSAAQALITCCELGLAACLVMNSALWDVGGLSSCREAESALQEARSLYLEAFAEVRSATQDVHVFA